MLPKTKAIFCAEKISIDEPITKAVNTYGMFLIMLKVDKVVARYLDEVFLLTMIETKLSYTDWRANLTRIDIAPNANPVSGDTIRLIEMIKPINISPFFTPNILFKRGVSWDAAAETKYIIAIKIPIWVSLKPNSTANISFSIS